MCASDVCCESVFTYIIYYDLFDNRLEAHKTSIKIHIKHITVYNYAIIRCFVLFCVVNSNGNFGERSENDARCVSIW